MGRSQKSKARTQRLKEARGSKYIYRNEVDKVCFQHDKPYGDYTDLSRSDKVLRDMAFDLANNPKYDGHKRRLTWMVYKFLGKKAGYTSSQTRTGISENQELANESSLEKFKGARYTR